MPALSLSDLVSPVPEDQMLDGLLSLIESFGVPARSWRPGGGLRTILRASARVLSNFSTAAAGANAAMFLDLSSKGWLTLVARYVFGVERVLATYATVTLHLVNTGAGVYTYGVGAVVARNPDTKKAYTNTAPIVLNAGDVLDVPFQASEIGSASNAAPNTITEFTTVLLGVTVTNPLAAVGTDDQADDDLKAVCRNKRSAVSVRGPRGAYAFAVQTAVRGDGSPVNINRMQIVPDPATGIVSIYCASPAGAPSSGDLDYVRDNIEAISRPDTVTAVVAAATAVPISKTLTVWARRQDGVASSDIATLVNNELILAIESYPIGGVSKPPASNQGYLYGDYVAAIVVGAHASIYDVDGADDDTALSPGQVATLATTINVRIVEVGGF